MFTSDSTIWQFIKWRNCQKNSNVEGKKWEAIQWKSEWWQQYLVWNVWPGMGVNLDSVLIDLHNQPEFRHQRRLALLFIGGWTLTLWVAAATIVAFSRSRIDQDVYFRTSALLYTEAVIMIPSFTAAKWHYVSFHSRFYSKREMKELAQWTLFKQNQTIDPPSKPLILHLQQNSPCMSESRLPWLETTLWTLLGLSFPQPGEGECVYSIYTTYGSIGNIKNKT